MSFYRRYILPRLVDLAMRNREVARYRSQVVPQACGTVVEIGIGSGLNLPFYGGDVERLYGIDPLWSKITGGCNLDRKMDALIGSAGFGVIELETEYAKGPRPMSYVYAGRAATPAN